jgi:hypothetical protein
MELFKRIVGYIVVGLQVMILTLLIFETQLSIPVWLQSIGRMHPLMLHLPIGLLLITTLIAFGQRLFRQSYDELFSFLLFLSALTASMSAFMGMILSFEGGYNTDDLAFHKWLGVLLSFVCWILISVKMGPKILRPALIVSTFILIITGHFGANLTHGENFILGPLAEEVKVERTLSDSATIFSAAIEPIFETKCYSCHNEEKAKGKLILTSQEAIARGGKNGVLWKSQESLLIDRLNLPLEHKKHMPPRDKAQLTSDEITFIEHWISAGANFEKRLIDLEQSDTMRLMANNIAERYHAPSTDHSIYTFASASAENISALNTPYRTVFRLASNEPALQVDFFLAESFTVKMIEELHVVKDQVVAINLSKMPITDEDLSMLKQFPNLEKLVLNQTKIDGSGLTILNDLPYLKTLALSGTNVTSESMKVFAKNRSLKDIYLWNTKVAANDINVLQKTNGAISWDIGFQPDENEVLRLSPPILSNESQVLKPNEKVFYKHNLPGSVIRYSINGEMPDSVSGEILKEPVAINDYAIIKTKAFKDGWISSNGSEHIFFVSGIKADRCVLLTKPEDRYPGEGGSTLTDGRKGMPDFYRDPVWMGFRNENLEALFFFENDPPLLTSVTLSYARNINAMCMPPAEMQIWGGNDELNLKLLTSLKPEQPSGYTATRIEGSNLQFPASRFKCYKLVAKTLTKLPAFRKAPKEKGWLMVDEVFLK